MLLFTLPFSEVRLDQPDMDDLTPPEELPVPRPYGASQLASMHDPRHGPEQAAERWKLVPRLGSTSSVGMER